MSAGPAGDSPDAGYEAYLADHYQPSARDAALVKVRLLTVAVGSAAAAATIWGAVILAATAPSSTVATPTAQR